MRKVLVGLAGYLSSGKDVVSARLVDTYGFNHVSTSDIIRFYMAEHGMGTPDRDSMRTIGTTLREERGADYLVRLALENDADYLVVSGLRAVAEVQAIKNAGGVILACIAPIEMRYERMSRRGRTGDGVSFEEFRAQEEKEMKSENPEGQNIAAVVAMADIVINNDKTLENLHAEVDRVAKEILQKS